MSLKLTIYVGTMTGTAELVAEEIRDWLEGEGGSAEIIDMDGLGVDAFSDPGPYLICTSTYGSGDVPDNAQGLFTALETERPDLSHVHYTLFGLGDSTYQDTFCFGGKRFDALMQELGANRIGGPFLHDASDGDLPEEAALPWFEHLLPLFPGSLREAA